MEEIKFEKQISLFEFTKFGMIKKSKTIENFLELQKIYKENRNKVIKYSSQRFVFDDSSFSIKITSEENKPAAKLKMCLIAAIGTKNELGTDGKLIWNIPNDMKRFKQLTSNHFILMGRKTFDSFNGRILPNRFHIVITRDVELLETDHTSGRVMYFNSVEAGINYIENQIGLYKDTYNQEKFWVIGGGEIYTQTINDADEIYLTRVINEIIEVPIDAYFPEVDMNKFNIIGNVPNELFGLKYYFTDMIKFSNKISENQTINNKMINVLLMSHLIKNLN